MRELTGTGFSRRNNNRPNNSGPVGHSGHTGSSGHHPSMNYQDQAPRGSFGGGFPNQGNYNGPQRNNRGGGGDRNRGRNLYN